MQIDSETGAQPFPVVGIGASAGGLEAISRLLTRLKPDLGMAYVIVQHLSPDHESLLPELLDRTTSMPVHQVTDGIKIEPDNVYVIPEASYMSIIDGHLALANRNKSDKQYRIIDYFLETLAPVYQNNAIGVILSGVGSDGTIGVQAIKAEGGITFAQDDSALFHAMAKNAYESGYVDIIQSPEGIADELEALARQDYTHLPPGESAEVDESNIKKIQALIFNHCGVDFSNYKRTTIHRRILRRMALKKTTTLPEYAQYLRESPKETELLYRDLLINVTYFFRESNLFVKLSEKIFPELIKDRSADDPIRIWIPACSSGEEAFSLGIAIFECLGEKVISTPVQIFATDLSDSAVERARLGIYHSSALQNVSPQRLRKFFNKIDGSYQIIKPIRDICVFASHNLLKDPPFSRIDLISCQNVMIYLLQNAQKKIFQAFHYALKPSRYLVLGKSESIGNNSELFESIDKEFKIYQRKTATSNLQFDFFSRVKPPLNYAKIEKFVSPDTNTESDIEKESDRILLSRYVPASVLINNDLQIVRFQGPVNNYLQPAAGKASLHLLKMVRNELVFEMRGLINKVKKEKRPLKKEGLNLSKEGVEKQVTIEITPVKYSAESYYLIVFLEHPLKNPVPVPTSSNTDEESDVRLRRIESLELELREAREHMKSINEDFEATREELQSANEEVMSSNEELQSINEELETSKEELQSTNEELTTINEELQLRNADLKESIEYIKAIVETIREPLVVLHTDLRIRTANWAFLNNFGLKSDIEGRFFYDIADGLFDLEDLKTQLLKTISKGTEFQDVELRVRNYNASGEKTLLFNAMRMVGEGSRRTRILLVIEEVTERRKAEENLRKSEQRLRLVIESAKEYSIFTISPTGIIDSWSPGAQNIFGYAEEEIVGRQSSVLYTPEDQEQNIPFREIHDALTHGSAQDERWHLRKDGTKFFASGVMSRISNDTSHGLVKIARDLTDRKLIDQHKDEFIGVASHELKTPVTTIRAYSELLEETLRGSNETNAAMLVGKLNKQVERLTNLVTDLLDVTKINEGHLQVKKEEFSINELIEKSVDEVKVINGDREFSYELAKDVRVFSDPVKLEQVIVNLLSNSIKYSPDNGKIIVRTVVDDQQVTVSIQDFGVGMSEETKTKAFDRFYRDGGNEKEALPGLGLGLFIASSIVHKLGGNIWAESKPAKGSTLSFTVPLNQF